MTTHRLEVRLTEKELEALDKARGLIPRATFSRAAINQAVEHGLDPHALPPHATETKEA